MGGPPQAEVPLAMPVTAPTSSGLVFESSPDIAISPRARTSAQRGHNIGRLVVIVLVPTLALLLALWGYRWVRYLLRHEPKNDAAAQNEQGNFSFDFSGLNAWRRDPQVERRLHVNLGMRRSNGSGGMGLFYRDFKTRTPNDAELVDTALEKLRAYFSEVEWELKPREDGIKLGSRPALHLEFQATDPENMAMAGECRMLTWHGYGYWFFTWVPNDDDKEAASADWPELRSHFRLLNEREDWQEKPRPRKNLSGQKVPYRLTYFTDVWGLETASEHDKLADVVLRGDEPDSNHNPVPAQERHASKVAWLKVLVLPPAEGLDEALKSARKHLLEREKADYPQTEIQEVAEKPGTGAEQTKKFGVWEGKLIRLHVINGENRERLMLMAIYNRPEGVLVLEGDCPWERRDFWEQEMLPIFQTLRSR